MVATGNVGLAFGLVAGAGLCTTLGAAVVFCASLAQPKLLAGSLGFAAGVMLYVSFAEIFMRKAVAGFQGVNFTNNEAYRWATLCFFGGCIIIAIMDKLVHLIAHVGARRSQRKAGAAGGGSGCGASPSTANLLSHEDQRNARNRQPADVAPAVLSMHKRRQPGTAASLAGGAAAAENLPAGGGDVESLHGGVGADAGLQLAAADACSDDGDGDGGSVSTHLADLSSPEPLTEPCDAMTSAVMAATSPDVVAAKPEEGGLAGEGEPAAVGGGTSSRTPPAVVEIMAGDHHAFMLKKMGLLTGLAIFIHNFPEGLATFVGALADTKIGVGLAVAIAMHNVPEGICVAMPIYYATGSRWKGFMWAFLSGVSEPIGALFGYLILDGNNDLSFAIVFGLVAGMMVYISVKELIPTALRYDPQDSVATTCVIAGMVVMAGSLLLFTI